MGAKHTVLSDGQSPIAAFTVPVQSYGMKNIPYGTECFLKTFIISLKERTECAINAILSKSFTALPTKAYKSESFLLAA